MRSAWRCLLLICSLWAAARTCAQEVTPSTSTLPRHALEIKALTDPEGVLIRLPSLIQDATSQQRFDELALLHLAEANACRVIANWQCQKQAGASAVAAAERSGDSVLIIRGLINESRALMALQDFTGGEQTLARAELLLLSHPDAELGADIYLAYSSMSHAIGKHQLADQYAARGLVALGPQRAPATRARLLRNQARANIAMGKPERARALLADGRIAAAQITDAKLSAEIFLESARLARQEGDSLGVQSAVEAMFALAKGLRNSQLVGLAHEVAGLSAHDHHKIDLAYSHFAQATAEFRKLGLVRDEVRVARELASVLIERNGDQSELATIVQRIIRIDRDVLNSDRTMAADDFDARLKYAQQQLNVLRADNEAALANARADTLAVRERWNNVLVALGLLAGLMLTGFLMLQRRSNARLRGALLQVQENQSRAADILRLSSGFVYLHDRSGRILMANPAISEALGVSSESLIGRNLAEFLTEGQGDEFSAYLQRVHQRQQDEGEWRIRHRRGGERVWRYSSRLNVSAPEHAHIIGQALDVTDQAELTVALRAQSLHDDLTGCHNRRYLEVFESAHAPDESWAVINIDLDHFKQINDQYGHEQGDSVLMAFADFLRTLLKAGDSVVRAGGDEFLLLLAQRDAAAAKLFMDDFLTARSLAPCAFSFGMACRLDGETLAETMAHADAQMFQQRDWARGRAGPIESAR